MTHKGTVLLETEQLLLRRFTMEDLEPMFRNCFSDPAVWKWTRYKPMHCIADVTEAAGLFTEDWMNAYQQPNRYSWDTIGGIRAS